MKTGFSWFPGIKVNVMKKTLLICLLGLILSCGSEVNDKASEYAYGYGKDVLPQKANELPVPPILKDKDDRRDNARYELVVRKGETEFFEGYPAVTLGYNGNILGPTIRVKRGDRVEIHVDNRLNEHTTVHWHGMLVPGHADGGPHQNIRPNGEWTARFTVDQPAATAWYHPHGIGNTAPQVYYGLAGLLIVDDGNSEKLDIPDKYGVNDIPLIIQDRRFSRDGILLYQTSMRDVMEGMTGDTIIVNGVVNAYLDVKRMKYRFRLLNGSNARTFRFSFSDDREFYLIATDAGFIEKPVRLREIVMTPGERAEIIVDFSDKKKGARISLQNGSETLVDFNVGEKAEDNTIIPEKLAGVRSLDPGLSVTTRRFDLQGMGYRVAINDRQMDMDYVNEKMKLNTVETWTIRSFPNDMGHGRMGPGRRGHHMMGRGMMGGRVTHNFHAHGVHFLILDRDGKPPKIYERGWKDTVRVDRDEVVRLVTRFRYKGLFMYHCHVLEHEDNGMMGQFLVQ